MQTALTSSQTYSLHLTLEGLSFYEKTTLLGLNWKTQMTIADLWSLCYAPALRFGNRGDHDRYLAAVGTTYGFSAQEIASFELRALRKLRHPSRTKRLESIFQQSNFANRPPTGIA